MSDEYRKRIQRNWVDIIRTVRVEDVEDLLYERGILTDEDLEYIHAGTDIDHREPVHRLRRTLSKGPNDAFEVFIEALWKDYDWLAERIMQTEVVSDEGNVGGEEELQSLTQQLADRENELEDVADETKAKEEEEIEALTQQLADRENKLKEVTKRYMELEHVMNEANVTMGKVEEYLRKKNTKTYTNQDVISMSQHETGIP